MLTRKRFLFQLWRNPLGDAGFAFDPGPDGAWSLLLWHALPRFVLQVGWAPRGWYTADSADEAAKQSLDDFRPGEQGEGFSEEWDRLDAEEQEILA